MADDSTNRFTTHVAVFVLVKDAAGRILLQRRANTGYLDGYWDFPGGHVEYGESLQDSATRELKEEVGLITQSEDLKLVHLDQYFLDRDYLNFTFLALKWQGMPKICEPDKCSAVEWFTLDDLPEDCVNAVRANQQTGFSDELSFSVTNREVFVALGLPESPKSS